jgi:cation-transporting ATPase 13A1
MQHSPLVPSDGAAAAAAMVPGAKVSVSAPPDGGCVAVVVRTGFETEQGGLMRKILFASERVTENSAETFQFIGILLFFACLSSLQVLRVGLFDESRNQFKLALHCIMIVTSVVPPELPMELSLAVTTSLAALSKGLVFCTEPFRIPLAGKVTTLCFDKTGCALLL